VRFSSPVLRRSSKRLADAGPAGAVVHLALDASYSTGSVMTAGPVSCAPTASVASRGVPVGFYQDQLLPRLQDKVMNRKSTLDVRRRVCAGLRGDVVEIGFGTGLNAPFYPPAVRTVQAIEPSALCLRIAKPRMDRARVPVEVVGLNGERLELPDEEFDAALSTWTLCSIPDLQAALTELHRVLKPGGALHFIEHGRAPDASVLAWQRRLEPLNKRLAGGCRLTRPIEECIKGAGFHIGELATYYLKGEPKVFGYSFEGRAVKP
jgi:SAM-dependent methyltransferase